MTQTRIWDFQAPDATATLNAGMLAALRASNVGSHATMQLRPGRIVGYVPTSNIVPDEYLDFDRDGHTSQMCMTNDGVIVTEDTDLDDALGPFPNAHATLDRIDLIVVKHAYVASLLNPAAVYSIVPGVAAAEPIPDYASVAADETVLAQVYIATDGVGNPPNITDADVRVMPTATGALVSDHEMAWSRTDNEFGDGNAWMRLGRNMDRFYIMRNPEDDDQVFMVLNAYFERGVHNRNSDTDGVCDPGAVDPDRFESALGLFITNGVKPGDDLTITGGANAGIYEVLTVVSETQLDIVVPFSGGATTLDTWSIESDAGKWYQEDVSKDSVLLSLDAGGGTAFEVFTAPANGLAGIFSSFWTSLSGTSKENFTPYFDIFSGDGSDGDLVVNTNIDLDLITPGKNVWKFRNLTINASGNLFTTGSPHLTLGVSGTLTIANGGRIHLTGGDGHISGNVNNHPQYADASLTAGPSENNKFSSVSMAFITNGYQPGDRIRIYSGPDQLIYYIREILSETECLVYGLWSTVPQSPVTYRAAPISGGADKSGGEGGWGSTYTGDYATGGGVRGNPFASDGDSGQGWSSIVPDGGIAANEPLLLAGGGGGGEGGNDDLYGAGGGGGGIGGQGGEYNVSSPTDGQNTLQKFLGAKVIALQGQTAAKAKRPMLFIDTGSLLDFHAAGVRAGDSLMIFGGANAGVYIIDKIWGVRSVTVTGTFTSYISNQSYAIVDQRHMDVATLQGLHRLITQGGHLGWGGGGGGGANGLAGNETGAGGGAGGGGLYIEARNTILPTGYVLSSNDGQCINVGGHYAKRFTSSGTDFVAAGVKRGDILEIITPVGGNNGKYRVLFTGIPTVNDLTIMVGKEPAIVWETGGTTGEDWGIIPMCFNVDGGKGGDSHYNYRGSGGAGGGGTVFVVSETWTPATDLERLSFWGGPRPVPGQPDRSSVGGDGYGIMLDLAQFGG